MSKKDKFTQLVDTPRRQALSQEIGEAQLEEVEQLITQEMPSEGAIIETPVRERLRREIGEKELERIESRILSGEL